MTFSSYFKRGHWAIIWLLLLAISLFLIPAISYAENSVSLKLETVLSAPGAEVKMPITIDRNSGLASLRFKIKYDNSALTLTSITFPKNTGTYYSVPEPYSTEQTINFVSPLSLYTETGTFATLTFSVNANAKMNNANDVSVEFDEGDIFDMDFNKVSLVATGGSVYVSDDSQGSKAVLPSALTVVGEESFMNTSFYYVVLPETTTAIESKAFADCRNLKYIYIPESTTKIADDAFLNVTGLTVYGKAGSYAEFFAGKKGYSFQVP